MTARRMPWTLIALFLPGLMAGVGLVLLRDHPRFAWLSDVSLCPWELWIVLGCGSAATAAGAADWRLHRSGKATVGAKEHRSELLALAGGGLPLFLLMAVASVLPRPHVLLVPILVIAGFTTVLICYDEFVFHRRRCDRYETMLHRILVFGMGAAWLAWVNWCFARGEMS